ncbi:MAG: hypothetical protein M3O20_05560 [Acidobacteriota bacterium]|nr:hypothetical protein [Acidobacteriota bacterium]
MAPAFEPIRIIEIVAKEVGEARNDGTQGSALYSVPFRLSRPAPADWGTLFTRNWDHPREFGTMHRPGIARVYGDRLYLERTTIEEVERAHKATLAVVLEDTNKTYGEYVQKRAAEEARERAERDERRKSVEEAAKRIKFD